MTRQERNRPFPVNELNPFYWKLLPTPDQIRSGITNGLAFIQEAIESELGGDTLAETDDEKLCRIVLQDLHFQVEELPGISMASYLPWDTALRQERSGEIPEPSYSDIYIRLCAMQRNRCRYVLQMYCEEIFEKDKALGRELGEKAGFPPEHFKSPDDWHIIEEADIVLEKARKVVLAGDHLFKF